MSKKNKPLRNQKFRTGNSHNMIWVNAVQDAVAGLKAEIEKMRKPPVFNSVGDTRGFRTTWHNMVNEALDQVQVEIDKWLGVYDE